MSELSLVKRGGGKKFATGTCISASETFVFMSADSNSGVTLNKIAVNNLGFTPSCVVAISTVSGQYGTRSLTVLYPEEQPCAGLGKVERITCYSSLFNMSKWPTANYIRLTGNAEITSDGFTLPVSRDSYTTQATYTYYAWE